MTWRTSDLALDTPGLFQIMIRLQMVRAQAQELLRAGVPHEAFANRELLLAIEGLANAARSAHLKGFTLVCLALKDRVELLRHGCIPDSVLALILDWAARAELHVRRPRFAEFARALATQLGEPAWGLQITPAQCDYLTLAMLCPGADDSGVASRDLPN